MLFLETEEWLVRLVRCQCQPSLPDCPLPSASPRPPPRPGAQPTAHPTLLHGGGWGKRLLLTLPSLGQTELFLFMGIRPHCPCVTKAPVVPPVSPSVVCGFPVSSQKRVVGRWMGESLAPSSPPVPGVMVPPACPSPTPQQGPVLTFCSHPGPAT